MPSRRSVSKLALVVAMGFLAGSAATAAADVRKGDRAPELSGATDVRDKAFKLKAYRGKWVVMTFGGSWCKPCKKELPAWDKLAAAWGDKVAFVAVNLDNDRGKGKKFMAGLKLKKLIQVYAPEDKSTAGDTYAPPTQPSSYVIDPKGIVRELHEGYRGGDDGRMQKLLESLVEK